MDYKALACTNAEWEDLIETFLDLEKDKMAEIAQGLQVGTFY